MADVNRRGSTVRDERRGSNRRRPARCRRSPTDIAWHRAAPVTSATMGPASGRPLPVRRVSARTGRDRRVRHAGGRRQGQGAQGRRPPGDRLRRRRARLPDARLHRRGGGRGRAATRVTTATRRPAGLPELREAIAAKTLRDSGYEVKPSQVLVTNGGKQAVYQAFATILDPGDEVLLPAPYWTTYPEAIRLAGGVPVEVFAGETQGYLVTVEQLEAARTAAHQGPAVLLPVQPDRRGVLPRAGRGDRPLGRSSTACGSSPTRSTSTSSTATRCSRSIVARRARSSRTRRSSSTASPRPMR